MVRAKRRLAVAHSAMGNVAPIPAIVVLLDLRKRSNVKITQKKKTISSFSCDREQNKCVSEQQNGITLSTKLFSLDEAHKKAKLEFNKIKQKNYYLWKAPLRRGKAEGMRGRNILRVSNRHLLCSNGVQNGEWTNGDGVRLLSNEQSQWGIGEWTIVVLNNIP